MITNFDDIALVLAHMQSICEEFADYNIVSRIVLIHDFVDPLMGSHTHGRISFTDSDELRIPLELYIRVDSGYAIITYDHIVQDDTFRAHRIPKCINNFCLNIMGVEGMIVRSFIETCGMSVEDIVANSGPMTL